MSSNKSLIESLENDVKRCKEELDNEFNAVDEYGKRIINLKRQEQLMDKWRECREKLNTEWDRQHNEWKQAHTEEDSSEEDSSDEDPSEEDIIRASKRQISKYKKQIATLEKKVTKWKKFLKRVYGV